MNGRRVVAIFGSSHVEQGSDEWDAAELAGSRCAASGLDVVTGGYGGVMTAASRGALMAGGVAIGITAPRLFPFRAGANSYVTYEIEAGTLAERIGILTDLAHGALVLEGSIGTAAELVFAWNLNHIARGSGGPRFPTVAVGEDWRELWRMLTRRVGAVGDDIHVVESVEEATDWLLARPELR